MKVYMARVVGTGRYVIDCTGDYNLSSEFRGKDGRLLKVVKSVWASDSTLQSNPKRKTKSDKAAYNLYRNLTRKYGEEFGREHVDAVAAEMSRMSAIWISERGVSTQHAA